KLDGIDHRRVTLFIRFRCRQIEEVGCLLGSNRLAESATRGGMERTSSACLGKRWRYIVARDDAQNAVFIQVEVPEFRLANARGILPHPPGQRLPFPPPPPPHLYPPP